MSINIARTAWECEPRQNVFSIKERDGSAISPSLWSLNTRYFRGDSAIKRFLASVDTAGFTGRSQIDAQWRSLRKRGQIQAIEAGALFFLGIDPVGDRELDWVRCKPVAPRHSYNDPNKLVKYETPPQQPLRVSFFRVDVATWQAIADRYYIPMPADVTVRNGAALGFWQWVQEHPEVELIVTEGEKKALSLLSAGFAAVSVPGVNCGYRCLKDRGGNVIKRSLHPDLLPFANRRVAITFDRDEKESTRLKVDGAILTTATLLTAAGALPVVVQWDGKRGKGIDDFIAAGGDVASLIANARPPQALNLHFARKRVAKRLGDYKPNLKVCVPCLSAIAPESIPRDGIIAIVGETGTGKTKLLERIIREVTAVIAPGFRVSLQRGLSQRIGLTYIKDADRGGGYFIDADGKQVYKVGLCWDSILSVPIWMYPDGSYDLILDEADQGFMHLISGATCGKDGKRPALVQRAINLIRGARRVLLASATLTRHELDLVADLRGEKPWILQNTYKANSYPITLYSGQQGVKGSTSDARAMAIKAIREAIAAGRRVIVPCDQLLTSKTVVTLGTSLGLMPHEIMRFDRETSSEDRQREFADAPDKFLERHDIRLFVHSPSLTSGVSIESNSFDLCVGIFEGQSISPDDALQALARVRKPIPRVVYASHYGKGNHRIDATRKADYLQQIERRTQLIERVTGHSTPNTVGDPIAEYHAATQADRNAAMATFGASLQALLEAAGHDVTVGTTIKAPDTVRYWRAMRRDALEADNWALHCSDITNEEEASTLRAKQHLKHADALKLLRFDLCDWYAINSLELSIDDVAYDRRGRTRRELSRLEALIWQDLSRSKDTADLDRLQSHNAPIQAHDLPDRELASQTAIALGIPELLQHCIESDGWHTETDWIKKFAATVRAYTADLKLAIGFKIHQRMTDCQIVGMILRHYGFSTTSRRLGSEKDRRRVYQLEIESLNTVRAILQRRAERHTGKGLQPCPHTLIKLILGGMDSSPSYLPNSTVTEAVTNSIKANAPPNSV
jgi:dephospho-CoA kinase